MSNKRIVNVEVQRLEEGCFLATSPDLPGMVVEGDTIEVLILEIFSVAGEMLEMTEGARLNPEIVYELYERGGQAKAARQPRVIAPASIFEVA